jgi:integrase
MSMSASLRDHFETYVLLHHLADADPSTIHEHRTSIRYWEESTGNASMQDYRTAYPKFLAFLKAKISKRKTLLSPATQRKHVQNIQFMLDRAGPETRDCAGAGLIERPIKIPLPKGGASLIKRPLSLLEISRLLLACQFAQWERKRVKMPACYFMRSLFLFDYNTGLRIETLFKLRKDWLETDDNGHRWFEIPEHAMKCSAFRCYVSPPAFAAIQPLWSLDSELVFPIPYTYNRLRSKFVELLELAQIPLRGLAANKFHALRRSCNDELCKINPFAAKLQLGHSTRDVTLEHYTSPAVLIEAHKKLPQPPWTNRRSAASDRFQCRASRCLSG